MSKGLSLQKHILVIFINNPGRQYTPEQILQIPALARRYPKSNTVNQALGRMYKLKLLDKITLAGKKVAFKLRDINRARQYIQGTLEHLTPHVPPPLKPTTVRHRVVHQLQLSKSEIEIAKGIGTFHPRANSGGFYSIKTENFNMTVYLTGKAQIFISKEPGWLPEFQHIFGIELAYTLKDQVINQKGTSGLAHPITTLGEKLYIDNCLVRVGRSQLPLEVDVHGPDQNVQGEMVESLWQDMKFRALVLNGLIAQKEQNEVMAQAINSMAIAQQDTNKLLNLLAGRQNEMVLGINTLASHQRDMVKEINDMKLVLISIGRMFEINQKGQKEIVEALGMLVNLLKPPEKKAESEIYPSEKTVSKTFDPSYQ